MSPIAPRVRAVALRVNNAAVRRVRGRLANPRRLDDAAWNTALERRWAEIRAEWDDFTGSGGRLPRIEDVLDEHQGNEGSWRAGLLVAHGAPVAPMADRFPRTTSALLGIPGLRSALWSELEAGAEIPDHRGPNSGVLRYHLGVRCGEGSALSVEGEVVPYRDGRGILFDDTVPHSAWNHGPEPRATLFCEVLRPLPVPLRALNAGVQALLARDPRYRLAPSRAAEWDRALNHAA